MPKKKTIWKTFSNEYLSINLPDSFIGGHPARDRKEMMAEVETLPEDIQNIFKTFFSQRHFVFMAADRKFSLEMTSLTCLVVLPESIPFFKFRSSIEKYIQEVKKNLGSSFETVEEDYFEVEGIPSARLLSIQKERKTRKNPDPKESRKHLLYAFRLRKRYWAFDFIADASVFDSYLPIFGESIKSIIFTDKAK